MVLRARSRLLIAAAVAAEYESLSLEYRADASRFERLLAPDFHEFGASGGEIGYAGIMVENMRGRLLADGLVMVMYRTTEGTRTARSQTAED
jgi:hypothetical protein